ncbi:MAG: hypothetical protein RDV48_11245 [Candidatus Eremiobacteraeota bacterium]|nr:hypothetical protein [Candidatus Eremiobacteraeota bacterium]
MARETMRNFHVPLPEALYKRLREEAAQSHMTSTELARLAIYRWLKEREKLMLRRSIEEYAAQFGGTKYDFDEDLSAASLELMLSQEER